MSRADTRSLRVDEIEAMLERYQQEQDLTDRRYAILTYVASQAGGMKKKSGGKFEVEDFLLLRKGPKKMTMEDMERKMKSLTMQMGGKVVGKG